MGYVFRGPPSGLARTHTCGLMWYKSPSDPRPLSAAIVLLLGIVAASAACQGKLASPGPKTPASPGSDAATFDSGDGDDGNRGDSGDSAIIDAADAPTHDATPMPDTDRQPDAGDVGYSSDAHDGTADAGMTEDCPYIRVSGTDGNTLNIRPGPSTDRPAIGSLPAGYVAEVRSKTRGETIDGNPWWYQIASSRGDGYVSAKFAVCTTHTPSMGDGMYRIPFACGRRVRVTQAPGGMTSHSGRLKYAYDFGVAQGTPIHAMRAGTVTAVRVATRPGDPCADGGGPSCGSKANWVIVEHADGTTGAYKHLKDSKARVGQMVESGDIVGRSGNTGYSTGPHLHLELRQGCPTQIYCQTIPVRFADAGEPTAGTTVTSGNCP